MSPDKTQELYDKFPELYRGRTKLATESLICFGFACDDGWFDLIAGLSRRIDDLAKAAGLSGDDYPEAIQVKEKLGGLRFYTGGVPDAIRDAIDAAEAKSVETCEVCGRPGKVEQLAYRVEDILAVGGRGRIRTLCDDCKEN